MHTKENVSNIIISIDTLIKIADYFEKEKEHYSKLYEYNKLLNQNLKLDNQRYVYNGYTNTVSYKLEFFSGEKIGKDDYNWFIQKLSSSDMSSIKSITITFYTQSSSQKNSQSKSIFNDISIYLQFCVDHIYTTFESKNMEEESNKIHSDIIDILQRCPTRYDKTIKNKFIRMQSLNLSIGFVFGYILLLITYIFKDKLPSNITDLLFFNKNIVIVLLFWAISSIFGNAIGQSINNKLYKNIAPSRKYSHYSPSQKQSVYVDNVNDYVAHVETQIGIFYDSIKKRKKIERIFKKTLPIVLLHIVISIIVILL